MTQAYFAALGEVPYQEAYALQLALANQRRQDLKHDIILALEHPAVFTLGRRGNRSHLGVSPHFLAERGIEVVHIERGGEVTYHGPGQLVVYPIINLRQAGLTVTAYVDRLEELMLLLAADSGIIAGRDPRNHGVWVGNNKLGSIGLAIRHGISFHGLALNINNDLRPFSWVNPCGLTGIGMTSLQQETGHRIEPQAVLRSLRRHLADLFTLELLVPSEGLLPSSFVCRQECRV